MYRAVPRRPNKAKLVAASLCAAICLTIVLGQISHIPLSEIQTALADIGPWQWCLAAISTLCSFWAMGQYDVIWHRHLQTGVERRKAHRTGMAATAIGQTVGLGLVTGTFVRWHLLQSQGFRTATAVTLGVSLSFFAAWALLALSAAGWTGLLHISLAFSGVSLALFLLPIAMRRLAHPALLWHMPRLVLIAGVDLACAGLALWAMIPEAGVALLPTVIAAYVLALGAGLMSNAPAGLGAFEMVLMLSLTTLPDASLIAAVLGFRLIYYVIPALLAAVVLLQAHRQTPTALIDTTAAPISDLCHQGAHLLDGDVTRRHIFGRITIEPTRALPARTPKPSGFHALYKCDARVAAKARRHGWVVRHIADDAILDLATWTTAGPSRRQLRRKLKQAEMAGVTISAPRNALPHVAMARVARHWADTHGGELGYAMGRYDPAYVAHQRVFLISQNGCLHGFVTVQTRRTAWAVDLIRHGPQMPAGAMHAAVSAIVAAAQSEAVATLALGAVPNGPTSSALQGRAIAAKAGMRQFKASFGPRWSPRYHAAPTRLQWVVTLSLVCLHIQRPLARLPSLIRHFRGEFINFTRIIHLNPPRGHVTDEGKSLQSKAAPHDTLVLETAG